MSDQLTYNYEQNYWYNIACQLAECKPSTTVFTYKDGSREVITEKKITLKVLTYYKKRAQYIRESLCEHGYTHYKTGRTYKHCLKCGK